MVCDGSSNCSRSCSSKADSLHWMFVISFYRMYLIWDPRQRCINRKAVNAVVPSELPEQSAIVSQS